MKRHIRRLAWVGVALCVILLALGVTERLLEPSPGVTETNARRIRPGMTFKQVEAIFGAGIEPGEKRAGMPRLLGAALDANRTIVVRFDGEDRVAEVVLITAGKEWEALTPDPFPLPRLRSFLGW
jgi:hypothetical protein